MNELAGSGPTLPPETLYVGTSGATVDAPQTLIALDLRTGHARWQVAIPQPALVGNDLVENAMGSSTALEVYDATTGTLRWQRTGVFFIGQASIPGMAASDPLLVNTGTGYAGLDPATRR